MIPNVPRTCASGHTLSLCVNFDAHALSMPRGHATAPRLHDPRANFVFPQCSAHPDGRWRPMASYGVLWREAYGRLACVCVPPRSAKASASSPREVAIRVYRQSLAGQSRRRAGVVHDAGSVGGDDGEKWRSGVTRRRGMARRVSVVRVPRPFIYSLTRFIHSLSLITAQSLGQAWTPDSRTPLDQPRPCGGRRSWVGYKARQWIDGDGSSFGKCYCVILPKFPSPPSTDAPVTALQGAWSWVPYHCIAV